MILPETDVKRLLFQRVSAIIYGFFNSISLAEMCEKRIAVKNLIEDHTMDKDAFKTQIQELLKAEALDAGAICKLIHEQLANGSGIECFCFQQLLNLRFECVLVHCMILN